MPSRSDDPLVPPAPAADSEAASPLDAAAERDMQLKVALYIESISAELRSMARGAQLDCLAYFLEMARLEASIQVERKALF